MSDASQKRPSFSTGSRWRIGFDVVLRTVLVIAVAAMVNYLGDRFFHRFYLSSQTRLELSARTQAVLSTITNRVDVTLYYDTHDQKNFYPTVLALLHEYSTVNPKITVRTVDYVRDAGEAAKLKDQYQRYFTSQSDKDLVIFDSGGRVQIFPGTALVQYKDKYVGTTPNPDNPKQTELEFERRPVAFNGEKAFTSRLIAMANPQPLKAYYVKGHGEPLLTDSDNNTGYQKFASALAENYISVTNLNFIGESIPADCNLLVIAGPNQAFESSELQAISQYLRDGGRLLMLFNYTSQSRPTGLENILQNWGVNVMQDIATDPNHTMSKGYDIVVDQYGNHPVVNSLSQVRLQLYLPRPILKLPPPQTANPPDVSELFATSPGATLLGNRAEAPHQYPLACAIEQKPVAGVVTPRGNTRIVVVGDSIFLGNTLIESGGNRDFVNSAVNWLCDRPVLLEGIDARPVNEFRLQITQLQQRQLRWVLLAGLPGGVLFFGWLVWLVRRK